MKTISTPTRPLPLHSRLQKFSQLLLLWCVAAFGVTATAIDAVYISEFVAANQNGLEDENGEASDWIEIFNSGNTPVNLSGWKLTDDASAPTKWTFPAVNLAPNAFLIVFASDKDRAGAGAPLHTNFKLSATGGYLGLYKPDGSVAHEYTNYPVQYDDRPYGLLQTVSTTQLVAPNNPVKVLIPTNNNLGTNWTARNFNDSGAEWSAGNSGVGFEATVTGFAFKTWFANVSVGSIDVANGVINTPSQQTSFFSETRAVINYLNTGGDGHYAPQSNPSWLASGDKEQYVVEAKGTITIPTTGEWTFGVNSDDGFELYVDNVRVCFYDGGRGASDTLGTVSLAAGEHAVRVMIYEGGGGSSGEFFAKSGRWAGWDSGFKLVGDLANGGLAVKSPPIGAASSGYLSQINKNIETAMKNISSSAYIRFPFSVADPASLTSLTLPIKYDDGFVAYLNGTEVARRNAPAGAVTNASVATTDRSASSALVYENIDLTAFRNQLVPTSTGNNILAVHGLNRAVVDNDFLIRPELAQYLVTTGAANFFNAGTPGAFNTSPIYNVVQPITISQEHGFFTAAFNVTLGTTTSGATIYYTFDGSTPSTTSATSAVYNGPINISKTTTLRYKAFKPGSDPSASGTQTYIFLADVINQSSSASASGPAPVIQNPAGASQATTSWPAPRLTGGQVYDYGMDPNVTKVAPYKDTIISDLQSLPSLSVVTDLPNLFDPSTGIYANPSGDTSAFERPASLELINPDGTRGFQINCGLRIRGGFSRSPDNPKHALRVFFRSEYGEGKLNYPLFGTEGADEFDKFDLRTFQNYSWAFQGDSGRGVFVRDTFSRRTQLDMGEPSSHGGYYHLYINGQYWGLYNIDERPEASFGATYFGGEQEDYDTIKVAPDNGYTIDATDGNFDAWFSLWQQADLGLLSTNTEAANNATYQKLIGNNPDGTRNPSYPVLLDPVNLIDLMLINLYGGNLDAPISAFLNNEAPNNWFGVRNRTGLAGGFKFVLHDSEHTLLNVDEDRTGPFPAGNSRIQAEVAFSKSSPQYIWQQCLFSAEFRQLAADRIYKHCFNNGALTPNVALARFNRLTSMIDRAVVAESARWGDAKTLNTTTGESPAFTRNDHWVPATNVVRNSFLPTRTNVLLAQLRGDGIFPSVNSPLFSQRGGTVAIGFELSISNPNTSTANQVLYYTLDGSDPRLLGGGISPNALVYSVPIVINNTTVVRARIKSATEWSAIEEGTFYTVNDYSGLTITELNYSPAPNGATSGDEYEFIEFKNTSSNTLDLGGMAITSGVSYTFPIPTTLAPGAFYIIAKNAARFGERYPGVAVNGVFVSGRLDNGGETIAVTTAQGVVILSFSFDDDPPWPIAADGNGFSLVSANPNSNPAPSNATNWRASANIGGSPGADDPSVSFDPIRVNEVTSNSATGLPDRIELFNSTAAPVNVGGWYLTDDPNAPKKYRIPNGTTIPGNGYVVFTENEFNPSPGVDPSFALSSAGEAVYLLSGDAAGNVLTGYSHGFSFGAAAADVSFGRYVNSAGEELFPAQVSKTFGASNSGPRVGPIVINELMYSPPSGFDEFVELKNITPNNVLLYDSANPANTWKVSGVTFNFPQGASLPANAFALIVAMEPAAFRTKYNIAAEVQIFGPYTGNLQDNGERVSLQRPDAPIAGTPVVIPYITVDEVRYSNAAPWPVGPAGSGPSLQRTDSTAFGDDPANWFASGITPGQTNAFNSPPSVTILSPTSGTGFTRPATISIQASATDVDGTVAKVEFYDGGTKIGEDVASPFEYLWTTATPGAHTITARATDQNLGVSASAPVMIFVNPPPIGTGVGITGTYYNQVNFSGPSISRIDTKIDLVLPPAPPDPSPTAYAPPVGINATSISCRWTGQILPRLSTTYTFTAYTNDGVRLYISDQPIGTGTPSVAPIINNYNFHNAREDVGFATLTAGRLYYIRMDWFQGNDAAVARLSWTATSEGLDKQIIPQSQLYPAGAPIIVTQPAAQTAEQGTNVTFGVLSSGQALTYQWRKNGVDIAGAVNESVIITDVQAFDNASYSVVISNSFGSVTSNNAPLNVVITDTDGDGIQDSWESAHGLNPNNAADAVLDSDGDGESNKEEFLAGTDSRSPTDVLKVVVSKNSGDVKLTFTAQSKKGYSVLYKNLLTDPTWIKLQDVAPLPGVRTVEIADPNSAANAQRFYQVTTPIQP